MNLSLTSAQRNSIEYYMRLAEAAATRSKCLDKQVGAVAVDKQGIVLATGFNGPPRSFKHCSQCLAEGNRGICPAVHAEQNVMLHAKPEDIHTLYVTLEPCHMCTRMLMNTSCQVVIFSRPTNPRKSGLILWQELHNNKTWIHYPMESK